jgi:hypothetical protein
VVVSKNGWRLLLKGASVVAGVLMLLLAAYFLIGASVMRGYGATDFPLNHLAVGSVVLALALLIWPRFLWLPSKSTGRGRGLSK